MLNLSSFTPYIKYNNFRFEVKWRLNDDFFDVVKADGQILLKVRMQMN